ncbi:hypothetical protein BG842_07410 [Haladaptatus sp. W1]|nr:hypothetical protein BG842_07410 [Haladaptatus sp. W1]
MEVMEHHITNYLMTIGSGFSSQDGSQDGQFHHGIQMSLLRNIEPQWRFVTVVPMIQNFVHRNLIPGKTNMKCYLM